MCDPCYQAWYTANKRKTRERKDPSEYASNYRKPPTRPSRVPDCHPGRPHAALGLCGACYQKDRPDRARAECHPDRPAVADALCNACYKRRAYDQNPEHYRTQVRASQAAGRRRLRDELIAAYGGRCACAKCPETNTAFLTLEHVGGTGKAHRAIVGRHAYADLRRRGFPQEGFTLLCWNCNSMKRFGRTCPHEQEEH